MCTKGRPRNSPGDVGAHVPICSLVQTCDAVADLTRWARQRRVTQSQGSAETREHLGEFIESPGFPTSDITGCENVLTNGHTMHGYSLFRFTQRSPWPREAGHSDKPWCSRKSLLHTLPSGLLRHQSNRRREGIFLDGINADIRRFRVKQLPFHHLGGSHLIS